MKKVIVFVLAIIICVIIVACAKPADDSRPGTNSTSPTANASNNIPVKEAVLSYTDPEVDLSVTLDTPGWVYTKDLYPGEVFFYPKDKKPEESSTGFAISSQSKNDKNTIEKTWGIVKTSLEKSIKELTVKQEADSKAGEFIIKRYHFSGKKDDNTEIIGDYFFWLTDRRLYICSFTSMKADYEKNLGTVQRALQSFKEANKK